MTTQEREPNICTPRDGPTADLALWLYLMNLPGWPHAMDSGRPSEGRRSNRRMLWWPTLKSYLWMHQIEDNNHGNRNGITSKEPPRDSA